MQPQETAVRNSSIRIYDAAKQRGNGSTSLSFGKCMLASIPEQSVYQVSIQAQPDPLIHAKFGDVCASLLRFLGKLTRIVILHR
jgi:hypothetical protein